MLHLLCECCYVRHLPVAVNMSSQVKAEPRKESIHFKTYLFGGSLFGRTFQSQLGGINGLLNPRILSRPVTLKVEKAKVQEIEDHDLHNIRIGRPQSPHLRIYAPQVTSMLSITHRFTGAALSSYLVILGVGYLALPNDISHYLTMLEGMQLSPILLLAAKALVAFPMSYHWCNGIRHLSWDTGRFLTIKEVYNTGYVMLACAITMTVALLCL